MNASKPAALAATPLAALSQMAPAATSPTVEQLVAHIQNTNDSIRGPAWQNAGPAGAPAVKPLAGLMTHKDFEIARAAKRGLWKIVRHAGRPGAQAEAESVERELIPLLASTPHTVRREVLWMLSEIGTDRAVEPMAVLLADKDSREDARCSLMRIPGPKAVAALKTAFGAAPEDFKHALAHALRVRGETVAGYPTRKRVPTKQTSVKQPTS
ncbi:MAG: HEAT repeat domain-containing protein [Verrucomicrobia bacterium]|nr:HEAT repeat domain-containing protein [Verrucomicrobiota bacterium]